MNNNLLNGKSVNGKPGLKIAIVHDWLVGGGAEKVILELHKLYPDAPIYTSYSTDEWRNKLDGKVVTGWLQHLGRIRKFIPFLRIWWFTRLDFTGYDLVISSSGNGEARGIRVPEGTLHVAYCNTPTHFYWRHYKQYLKEPGFGIFNPLARLGLRVLVRPLRKWDYAAAQRADYVIANSTHIQSEIKKFYDRDSIVIHPPVDTARFNLLNINYQLSKPRRGFVTAGRQVPLKKTALIIEACNQLKLPLTVIGRGPEHNNLVSLAGSTVTVLDSVTDDEMPSLFMGAEGFIFASYEDFGITPVEALAAGTPVIAYKAGGAVDYVQEGVTGTFFNFQTVASLTDTLRSFKSGDYDVKKIKEISEKFSQKSFHIAITGFLDEVMRKGKS